MNYSFRANVWLYPGFEANWHFVSLPKKEAGEIALRQAQSKKRRGFGAVRVKAKIGGTSWETSIFPDKKSGTYILPLKAQVRKKEGIASGDPVSITLMLSRTSARGG